MYQKSVIIGPYTAKFIPDLNGRVFFARILPQAAKKKGHETVRHAYAIVMTSLEICHF